MTTQAAPVIPPRPSRSPQSSLDPKSISDMPGIPPRPSRRVERSVSPFRDSYAPSPLNGPPNAAGLTRTVSNDLPQRPPSVTIPSLGEEGIEYQGLDIGNGSDGHHQIGTPAETRNVGSDLKIHAPRPSLPSSSAKAKVQAVTRTDSRQAAAAGLGVPGSPAPDDHHERPSRSLHSRASGSRADSSTASSDRRRSLQLTADEHGIPEIGQRVPMLMNAGDVQAPSPSPYQLEHGGQRQGRHHHRTRSGREASLPPGSYGLHGHGVPANDKFEKAWYEKHPEEYVKVEHGQYGPGVGTPRPDWALSSDDLNKIVRSSAVTGSGLGTSPNVAGTPDEEVGYIATDEYTHRMVTPAPESRRGSRLIAESPLRNTDVPASEDAGIEREGRKSEDAGVIHVDDPYHPLHHPDGFAPTPAPEEQSRELGDGLEDEDEPILAADEVRPESAFQHPAVSPTFDRRTSDYDGRSRTPSVNHSRSNSRSAAHQGGMPALVRYSSRDERDDTHTPLDDVEEYEPLFPEDDKDQKPISAADRFKQRPEMLKHRFPSEDIWEDSPNSLQLHATVSTPDIPKHEAFETPEQETFRRSHAPQLDHRQVAERILESNEPKGKTQRPEISKQRFPSQDIWEDAPESQRLVTTIEPADENEVKSPDVPSKPAIPSRPAKFSQQPPAVDASSKPATSPTEKRQPPSIPGRPKPQIPTRPAKPITRGAGEETKEAPAKEKPAVPVRPNGSKIAALKAGFLSDLNSRLQMGPQAPKPQEKKEEEAPAEKAPLSDARKGRARGPARRKPASENVSTRLPTIPEIKITETWNVWQVGEDGNLTVETGVKANQPELAAPECSTSKDTMAPALSKNIAGESTDPSPMTATKESAPETDETIPSADGKAVAVSPTESTKPGEVQQPSPDAQSEIKRSTSPPVDDAIEAMAAAADGKRASEGSVLEQEQ